MVDDRKAFWESLLAATPLVKFMTTNDLAFAVVILEQHMMMWRHLVNYELETGHPPSEVERKKAGGLLYNNGISGKEARKRFDDLCVYLFANFCSEKCPQRDQNVARLQELVNKLARNDTAAIRGSISKNGNSLGHSVQQLQDEVLHRVFYYIHL